LALDVSGHEYADHEPWVLADRLPIGLLVLTAVSGTLDAVSFLALGHIFTANMTGNVVFLAFAAVGTPGISVARSITSLAAFLSGAIVGGYLYRGNPGPIRCHWLRVSATCEAALLFAAAIAAIALDGDSTALQDRQYAVIVLLAVAMGLRTATVRQIAVPDLTTTTMVTITLTALVADLALAGSSSSHTSRRVASIASLFVGAALGALLLRLGLPVPLIVAAVCVLAATAYAAPPWNLSIVGPPSSLGARREKR
jgi:uncharacterized membrane protein YoaK (UPF0700 family)